MFQKNPVLSAQSWVFEVFQKKCVGFCRFCPLRQESQYKLIQGSKVFIPKGDILLEQERLLTGKMSKYPLSQRFNFELVPETQDVEIIKVSASKRKLQMPITHFFKKPKDSNL